jgi:D-sedoheptulose 7-phosphate isomerase
VANDWDYSEIFSRQVLALARPGDVVIGLSTSGRSENVAKALAAARSVGATPLALTGAQGRVVGRQADLVLAVPTTSTPRIQELHILALHALCDLVEEAIFGSSAHPES